jgi:SRSO17 transposase
MLAQATWQTISWRTGTKGKLKARFAVVRVWVADGPRRGIRGKTQQCVPGEEAWLVGEHRASGEKKCYLANLPENTSLRTLAETIKGRWICEQAHQQLKEELGLDHFEGRSWRGLHRHTLMTMIAYAFLQFRRLAAAKRKKRINGPPPQQVCPPYGTPFSLSSSDHRHSSVLTAEIGYTKSGSMNEFCQSSAREAECNSIS